VPNSPPESCRYRCRASATRGVRVGSGCRASPDRALRGWRCRVSDRWTRDQRPALSRSMSVCDTPQTSSGQRPCSEECEALAALVAHRLALGLVARALAEGRLPRCGEDEEALARCLFVAAPDCAVSPEPGASAGASAVALGLCGGSGADGFSSSTSPPPNRNTRTSNRVKRATPEPRRREPH